MKELKYVSYGKITILLGGGGVVPYGDVPFLGLTFSNLYAIMAIFIFIFIINYLNTKSLQQYKVTKEKSLITIIHYNIYIFTVYLSKTYYEAAAVPGSRVFVFFQLLK